MRETNVTKDSVLCTFFVPCLNEEHNIVGTIEDIIRSVDNVGIDSYEILINDDCSDDDTSLVVEKYLKENPGTPITINCNKMVRGLGFGFAECSYIARGKYYMMVSGDGSISRQAIEAVLRELGKADIVVPYWGQQDPRALPRAILSKLFTSIVNVLSGETIRYYNGNVGHIRSNVMRWHSETYGFAYQAEIITRLLLETDATYIEVPVRFVDRKEGVSNALKLQNVLSIIHSFLNIVLRRIRQSLFYRKDLNK